MLPKGVGDIGYCMDSIELNAAMEVPAETLAVLTEISREINSSLNLDDVLKGKPTKPFTLKSMDKIYVPERFTWW